MSTERLSFGFNSLIPETYKNKAEAFAKCLQHKLLSLGRIDSSSDSYSGGNRRLTNDDEQGSQGHYAGNEEKTTCKPEKTDDSEEEFCSHSESENGDWIEKKEQTQTKQKLTSMSSEDSTLDSWSSCQENLTDFEKPDSENEDSSLAAQIRGSPKLRSFNMRTKRKELREKTWKKNSKKNQSSSTESIQTESYKETQNHQGENFDLEFSSQYILLDGFEPENDEVPHRVLRESSSTSNLEKHFCRREEQGGGSNKNSFKLEKEVSEDSSVGVETELLTPPPSPDLKRKVHEENLKKEAGVMDNRLNFAQVETDFVGIESVTDFNMDDMSRSVMKIGGTIIECRSDCPKKDSEATFSSPVITAVEVFQNSDATETKEGTPPNYEEEKDIETEEDNEMLDNRSKMRRCSSLKTWKTPPGTPGGKKIVRFADALGLDLADVRTFLDEIPKIPSSAYEDLHFDFPKSQQLPPPPPTPSLVPLFQQPGNKMDFLEKVKSQKICLESTVITEEGVLTVTGFIRVQNLSFHKSVHVRYTLNNWQSFSDLQATYVLNSSDGFSDRFSFVLFGHTLKIGQKLEFAIRLECCGMHYWDNNEGINYVFHCLPKTSTSGFFSSLTNNQVDPWFDFY